MSLNKLVLNLESQIEMHSTLLDILRQEKALPASCSIIDLYEIHSARDCSVMRISELERARIQLIEQYKREKGHAKEITFDEIVGGCDLETGNVLNKLRSQLKNVIKEIQSAGKKTAEQAIARITCFNEVEKRIQKSFLRHSLYSMDGLVHKPKGACLVQKTI
ncbi:flagellar protein FlgN [bacterium]|nr:flagellar protein FlgN [bacterium]